MSYLVLASRAAAEARSRAAYAPLRPADEPEGAITEAVWLALDHPTDGRAALEIPATPAEAGLGLSQQDYDALLTAGERATLVAELPEDWTLPSLG